MPSTAAASNVPVGTAGAANAPTSTNDELLKSMVAFNEKQGKTNTDLAAAQEKTNTNVAELMSAQGKTNDTLTAIAQNHDGRISDLENGQETNTSDIANLKDGQETNTSDIAKHTNRIAELEEAVTTIKKAAQNNTAPIDPADLPGTRLTYELDSKPAGDSILDEAATPVKPPAAKVTSGNAVTPQVTPRHCYSSKAADVVPPTSMKKPSTAVAVALGGSVGGSNEIASKSVAVPSVVGTFNKRAFNGPSLVIPALAMIFLNTSSCRKLDCYLAMLEKKAVVKYVTDGPTWNEKLREGTQLDGKDHAYVTRLIMALNALPIVSVLNNQLPEGLIGEGIRDVMSFYVDQMPKQLFRADNCTPDRIQEFRKIMEDGSSWSDKGFLSTSLVEVWDTQKFCTHNTRITIVNPKTGKLIEEIGNKKSSGKGEHEVLFNRNTPFRVLRVEEDKDKDHNCAGKYCILLKEIAEWPQF